MSDTATPNLAAAAQPGASTPLYSIPSAGMTMCGECGQSGEMFADRKGHIYCRACAGVHGQPLAGSDCATCRDGSCGCPPGGPGCEHRLCPAFLAGGIVPDDVCERYASCPGAPREVVAVRALARAVRLDVMALLSPGARARLLRLTEGDR